MTILESILSFTGMSIASGVSWDVLKMSGKNIISGFKKLFLKNDSFSEEKQCEEFLRLITINKPNSKKNPYNDIKSIYEDIVDKPKENFIDIFKQWITENKEDFSKMNNYNNQYASIKIEYQENKGSGTIINAGIINK